MSLRRFVIKRLLLIGPLLLGVSVVTFLLVHLAPGSPIEQAIRLNPDMSVTEKARFRQRYNVGQPLWDQYLSWIKGVLVGDFGTELQSGREVSGIIERRLPRTIALGFFGWLFALIVAIPTGIYSAVHKNEFGDTVSRFVALSGISIPNFWLGLMLILVFAIQLDFFTVLAPDKPLYHPDMLYYLLLPGITIGTASASSLMRVLRTSMGEELNKEYVTAARAKGLPERTVLYKHVLRNSLISVVTLAATLTASIVGGSVVVEQVFAWPGLGSKLVEAVQQKEINLILGITLFTGVFIIIANLVADVLYAALDPRIRYE